MTVLRDGNGVVHFIPNGTIDSVSNETHGWSRAVCEIAINHTEDLELVLHLLRQTAEELIADETIAALLLDVPTQPSVENLDGVVIRIKHAVRTQPNKQGLVKQHWLKLIKRSLMTNGISAPYADVSPRLRRIDPSQAA